MNARLRAALPYAGWTLFAIGIVNGVWVFAEAMAWGGYAVNGYEGGGHYFLELEEGGPYAEVARSTWEWSRLHTTSLLVTQPLGVVGALVLAFRRKLALKRSS